QLRLVVIEIPAIEDAEKGWRQPKFGTWRQAAYQRHAAPREAEQRVEHTSQAPAADLHGEILPRLAAHRPTLPASDVSERGFGYALASRTDDVLQRRRHPHKAPAFACHPVRRKPGLGMRSHRTHLGLEQGRIDAGLE